MIGAPLATLCSPHSKQSAFLFRALPECWLQPTSRMSNASAGYCWQTLPEGHSSTSHRYYEVPAVFQSWQLEGIAF
jgi:hypothetical protein